MGREIHRNREREHRIDVHRKLEQRKAEAGEDGEKPEEARDLVDDEREDGEFGSGL